MASHNASAPRRQQETTANARDAFSDMRRGSFTPSVITNAPIVINADVPPSQTANGRCDCAANAAAYICPGSPRSVSNSKAKGTNVARDQVAAMNDVCAGAE